MGVVQEPHEAERQLPPGGEPDPGEDERTPRPAEKDAEPDCNPEQGTGQEPRGDTVGRREHHAAHGERREPVGYASGPPEGEPPEQHPADARGEPENDVERISEDRQEIGLLGERVSHRIEHPGG